MGQGGTAACQSVVNRRNMTCQPCGEIIMTPASSQDPPHAKLVELEETNGARGGSTSSLEVMTARQGVSII